MKSQPSSPDQLKDLITLVIDTFGSKSVAESWLNSYNDSLGAAPIDAAQSCSGFLDVQKVLSAINHGGAV